jgi:hypothetical protein
LTALHGGPPAACSGLLLVMAENLRYTDGLARL